MSTDLERMSLNSYSANSVDSGGRTLSGNVRKLHNALNLLLSDYEREQFIHCLNIYHSKRNVFDLVQTLKVILNTQSKRQLLPMLRLVIPRSDQLLFDQYTSEGLYLKSDLLANNAILESEVDNSDQSPTPAEQVSAQSESLYSGHASLRSSTDSFSTKTGETAPFVPLLGRVSMDELPAEIRQVTLKRNKSNEGLGFSIRGGSEHGVGIYVSLVEPGSLAEKEGLRVGDQILKVNDKVFDRVTHAEAVKVLKGCKKLSMSVCSVGRIPGGYVTNHVYTWVDPQGRSVSPPPDLPEHCGATLRQAGSKRHGNLQMLQEGDEKRVNLVLDDGRSLGLMIRGGAEYALGIYITGVDWGSAAEYGGLKVGDQILEVNGRSFLSIPHEEAVRTLKSSHHLMMTVKDVGRLPHARTTVDETKWITSSQIGSQSWAGGGSIARLSLDKCASAPGKALLHKGVAGSQVTLSSLLNQPRAMLEERARHLFTIPERQTMAYYLEEYREGHIGVEQLIMALFELLDTHAKFSLLSEVRGLVAPQDLERFDRLVLHREIEAMKARRGDQESPKPSPPCMVPCPDMLASAACYLTSTAVGSAWNDSRLEGSKEGLRASRDALPDISLDEVASTTDSPPSFKPPPPPRATKHPVRQEKAKRSSSGSSQSGLFFTAPCSVPQERRLTSPSSCPSQKEALSQLPHRPFPHALPSGANNPVSPSRSPPSVSVPAPPPSSPEKLMPSSPTSSQHFVMVDVHRPRKEPGTNEVRGATLPQLSDSGQTLSEDSGVDIAESGGLSKESSPRPGKTRPLREAPHGLLELTPTLVRVPKSASTLGIAIEGGANTRQPLPRIVTMQRGGSAHIGGQLKVGQVILEVNGMALRGREHQEAARLIAEAFKTKERDHVDFLVTDFNVAL